MIRFTLRCDQGHSFDSWFRSSDAFDGLAAQGHVACADCGSTAVEKAVMAPMVSTSGEIDVPKREAALKALREKVEASSDYVGEAFAREARAMHLGDTPHRPIWGEAKPAEARSLIEDGVPVLPLPFTPRKKAH